MNDFTRPVKVFLAHHWKGALKWRERLQPNEGAIHLLIAGVVGLIGGLANLLFYSCIESVRHLAMGPEGAGGGDIAEIAEILDPWKRLISPALGGLAAGLVLFWGVRVVGGRPTSNLLEVVVAGDGRLPFRSGMIRILSSLLSIGTGASIGREGSVVHLAATLASKWGQLARWHPYRLRLMVACGAASGIAAAYNAPLAGAIFASQIVLGNFSMNLFAPIVFSSVVAAIVTRSFFGIEQWYDLPPFAFNKLSQLPSFLILGLVSGLAGAGFLKLLRMSEKMFNLLPTAPYLRLFLGGLGVGLIAIYYPWVWGNGYSPATRILSNEYSLLFLITLLCAKVIAILFSVGSGAVGGVFTPTLFMGAALGSIFGSLLHMVGVAAGLPVSTFALAGMGSMLAATTHAPLLASIMIFEMSLDYSMMPPLMLACVVSALVARECYKESIYTEPLRQKNLDCERESNEYGASVIHTVGDMMRDPVAPVRDNAALEDIANRFLTSTNNFLPVVDANGTLNGVVALQDLKGFLNSAQEIRGVISYDIMRPVPVYITPDQKLTDILPDLLSSELRNIPVVNNRREKKLIGSIVRAEALGTLSEAIAYGQRTTQ